MVTVRAKIWAGGVEDATKAHTYTRRRPGVVGKLRRVARPRYSELSLELLLFHFPEPRSCQLYFFFGVFARVLVALL